MFLSSLHLVWCFPALSSTTSSVSKMKFENVLAEVNGFGRFQIRTLLFLVIPRVTLPFHFLLNNFITVIPSHHCNISSLDDGERFRSLSPEDKLVVSIPLQSDGSPSFCQMFAEPQYHLLYNSTNTTDLPTIPCQNGWVYDNSIFKSTLATEVSFACTFFRYYIYPLSLLSVFHFSGTWFVIREVWTELQPPSSSWGLWLEQQLLAILVTGVDIPHMFPISWFIFYVFKTFRKILNFPERKIRSTKWYC